MRYLSVCSGIEAATVAWHPLGWEPVAFSEVDAFPSAVLKHHYPHVPNWGDMTQFKDWPDAAFDLLVGGTPCQSFSVAGLRKGLDDPRGNLLLVYLALARRYRPRWLVWENVPGVLSADDGRAFGSLLGGLAELGYGFAYRVLDAQHFNLAQRRQRVFVVGCFGDWRRAAAVLFERESLSGHPAPRREAGQEVAPSLTVRAGGGCGPGDDFEQNGGLVPELAPTARQSDVIQYGDQAGPLDTDGHSIAVAFAQNQRDEVRLMDVAGALASDPGMKQTTYVAIGLDEEQNAVEDGFGCLKARREGGGFEGTVMTPTMAVRRLTPKECCRLQGFPDDYLDILYRGKPAADGPKYKALGNSMAVPVMAWIGQRIQMVEQIAAEAVA